VRIETHSFLLVMTTSTSEKEDGMTALATAIEKIRDKINAIDGGQFNVKTEVSFSFCIFLQLIKLMFLFSLT
jgi:hypothetical protein